MPNAIKEAGTKTQYSIEEIAQLWIEEGGPPQWAYPQALVAWAESRGKSDVVNSIGATGLYQHYPGDESLKDPHANTRLAIQKFKARKFQPWVSSQGTWSKWFNPSSGVLTAAGKKEIESSKGGDNIFDKAKDFLTQPLLKSAGVSNPLEGIVAPLQNIAESIGAVSDFLIHPRRLMKLVMGGIILLWGINQLSKSMGGPQPGRAISRGASKATLATPVGKAAKAAGPIGKGAK